MMRRALFLLSTLALLASLLGAAAVLHQHARQTFGAVSGLPDPALDQRPASILAVNVALEQYGELDPVFDSLAGFAWVRQTFAWAAIEPARGQPDWARWDAIVAAARAHDKQIIAVLTGAPAWARDPSLAASSSRTTPPLRPSDFGAFAAAFAARYAGEIDVYQIWDEPNIALGWGGLPPSAAAYAGLLEAGYAAIHAADPDALVLAAALAPTVETGPENLSDLLYLQQLYDLGAAAYFDAAAGKPYGFYTGPDDRAADPAILNFSRLTLLRQVMERNGDGHKLLWGGNFGWNRASPPSPWGQATPEQQAAYTLDAYRRARSEWPWAGPLALEAYQPGPGVAPDDPHWGFALVDPSGEAAPLLGALSAFGRAEESAQAAFPGNYPAQHPAAEYTGDWEFSELGADIPQETYAGAGIEIAFEGTDFALRVRRGDYRGYLYVEVDGQPANRLPPDSESRGAYIVLTAPQLAPEVVTIPVASGLAAGETHRAVIYPDRGWDQWAIAGFSVGRRWPDGGFRWALGLLAILAFAGAAGTFHFGTGLGWEKASASVRRAWDRLGTTGQIGLTALVSVLLYASSWLTLGDEMIRVSRRFGDALPIAVTALTAGLFYFSPSALIGLAALAVLFVLLYLRLDLAPAFIMLFVPFYLHPRLLWQRGFSLSEVILLLACAAWVLQNIRPILAGRTGRLRLTGLDWGVAALLVVATASLATAELKTVAVREYRLVILEPVLFYALVRALPLSRPAVWRIVDFFLIGAVAVAVIGLYQYASGTDLITAEGGAARIRSVYGSPNNLALYLGRAVPIGAAVAVMGPAGPRRWLYGLALLILAPALLLTLSKGALLLGAPAALAVIAIAWLGRRGLLLAGAAVLAGLAALPIVGRLPRFAGLLDLAGGTSFFRVKLWVSAWRMFLDHPLLGVGLDNFLYQYRGRYILPEAWQEPNLSHPHNVVLDFATRLGVLGLACGIWLQAAFWRQIAEVYRRSAAVPAVRALAVGLMASMADMLAHGLVDHAFFLADLSFVFFLTVGLVPHLLGLSAGRPEDREAPAASVKIARQAT